MHSSTLFAVLLLLGTESLAANLRRHPKASVEQIHNHLDRAITHPLSGGKKGKRLVRKKRASCVVPSGNSTSTAPVLVGTAIVSDPVSTSTTSDATSTTSDAASTTAIGQNNNAIPSPSPSPSPSTTSTTSSAKPSSTSSWYLTDTWAGNSFFDNWNFWSWDDPTHGTVQYLNAADSWNSGLISINSAGQAIMKVDTTQQVTGGRKSIRIHGNKVWTGGLVLMDASHMPTGCGTWPAWWQNGPNWPYGGEIDILEGVNAFTQNQVSLHTGSGCTMPSNQNNLQTGTLTTGSFDSYNCASYDTANQGCGVRDMQSDNSYGTLFNNVGGGVYAMLWAKVGIKVWWFPRYSIPADITANQPDPSTWGTPVADFPSANCSPYQFFYDHYNIFDTTLCGDWAGPDAVWNYAGYAGQSQSCASITGYATCSDYVLNNGAAFSEAYWAVNYVKYFNSTSEV